MLAALGRLVAFELAVGLNGRVWIKAGTVRHTILLANALAASEHMLPEHVDALLKDMWRE